MLQQISLCCYIANDQPASFYMRLLAVFDIFYIIAAEWFAAMPFHMIVVFDYNKFH